MWIAAEAVATKTFYISLNRKQINETFANDLEYVGITDLKPFHFNNRKLLPITVKVVLLLTSKL